MNGRDFLQIAETFRASDDEAERRTSIGRAYYALFNAVIQTLEGQQIRFKGKAEDHGDLTKYLKTSGDPIAFKIGEALVDLRFKRNNADYGMKATITSQTSKWTYRQASDGFALLQQLNPIAIAAKIRRMQ